MIFELDVSQVITGMSFTHKRVHNVFLELFCVRCLLDTKSNKPKKPKT